jgi:acetylglutamate kinase
MNNMRSDISIQAKTEVLTEALPYFQRFRGSIFVVKFGGSFMDTEQARIGVATDIVFLATVGIHVIVVHGGGPAINAAMDAAKLTPQWRNGLRVTDAATVEIVEQVLNEVTNPAICANLEARGGRPTGLRGQDVFSCERLDRDVDGNPLDIGFVGRVIGVRDHVMKRCLEEQTIPVVSPLAKDSSGQCHNINADAAAACMASAVGARRLVYLCDVPGLLRDPKDPQSLISTVRTDEVPALRAAGIVGSGMLPKVESAVGAIEQGVHRVHFIDGRLPHSLLLEIFTDRGVGTEIVRPHEKGAS